MGFSVAPFKEDWGCCAVVEPPHNTPLPSLNCVNPKDLVMLTQYVLDSSRKYFSQLGYDVFEQVKNADAEYLQDYDNHDNNQNK